MKTDPKGKSGETLHYTGLLKQKFLMVFKKNLDASKPSEHPPSGEKMFKGLGCSVGFPNDCCMGPTPMVVYCTLTYPNRLVGARHILLTFCGVRCQTFSFSLFCIIIILFSRPQAELATVYSCPCHCLHAWVVSHRL